MPTPNYRIAKRKQSFQRELDQGLEDIRDDCIAMFINSGLKQKEVTARGGPTPGTISKWLYRETRFPRYQTIASFAAAMGAKLVIVDRSTKRAEVAPIKPETAQHSPRKRPEMPPKKTRLRNGKLGKRA